jgi:hypothetical protein
MMNNWKEAKASTSTLLCAKARAECRRTTR